MPEGVEKQLRRRKSPTCLPSSRSTNIPMIKRPARFRDSRQSDPTIPHRALHAVRTDSATAVNTARVNPRRFAWRIPRLSARFSHSSSGRGRSRFLRLGSQPRRNSATHLTDCPISRWQEYRHVAPHGWRCAPIAAGTARVASGSGNTLRLDHAATTPATASEATPWRTLQHAANQVQAGDTVIVRAGNYVGFHLRRRRHRGQSDHVPRPKPA